MKIVWDEPKRMANILKHGLDFADLDPDFFAVAVIVAAKGKRLMAIGLFEGDTVIAVVHAKLGVEAVSVVSMRRADRKERSVVND